MSNKNTPQKTSDRGSVLRVWGFGFFVGALVTYLVPAEIRALLCKGVNKSLYDTGACSFGENMLFGFVIYGLVTLMCVTGFVLLIISLVLTLRSR
jgi:hypothetical protein